MKKLLSLLLVISAIIPPLGISKEVKFISKGTVAPYDGYIFDLEAEQFNRLELMEKDNLVKQLSLFKENEKIYQSNSLMWQNVATQNTERLVKMESNTFWQNTLFFGLGVLVTGALAIGLSKGLNH